MAMLVVDSELAVRVSAFAAPLIERAQTWDDDWTADPELEFVNCRLRASSSQVDSCELRRRYGNVKAPYEPDFPGTPRTQEDLRGQWIRVSFVGETVSEPVVHFVGRIEETSLAMAGGDGSAGGAPPSGAQSFVAAGGLRILEKMTISESFFMRSDGAASQVGWLPAMNGRDPRGLLVGNKSATRFQDICYLYDGGPQAGVWSHLDYLVYLVGQFFNTPAAQNGDAPFWTVGGQTDILDAMQTTVKFPEAATALEIMRMIVPVRYGVDFFVRPTDAGFEITIFALNGTAVAAGGSTMPANPNTVQIDRGTQMIFTSVQLVDSQAKQVDRVRVVGKRITVCGTLDGGDGVLSPKWGQDLEALYIAASDKDREAPRFRAVYQQYGAPVDWDKSGWRIACDGAGNLTLDNGTVSGQTRVRETLHTLPLKEGFDYSADPPTDNTLDGQEPDYVAPMAWVYWEAPTDGTTPHSVAAHGSDAHMHVSVPHLDWGVLLEASPNHLLAWRQWGSDQTATTTTVPAFDGLLTVATIAIESDTRLELSYTLPDDVAAGDGSTMTLLDEEAEAWVLLPGTALELPTPASPGDPVPDWIVSPDHLVVLRNDQDRLALMLAGAVARYINERAKARLTFKGFLPWAGLLGWILTVVQQGDIQGNVGAPITGIDWNGGGSGGGAGGGGSPETLISVGYA